MKKVLAMLLLAGALLAMPFSTAGAGTGVTRYTVVLAGTATEDGFALSGTREAALALVASAGGKVTMDLSRQIGVLGVESSNALFLDVARSSLLVADAAEEHVWKSIPSYEEALASGQLTLVGPESQCPNPDDPDCPPSGPEVTQDPLEELQWDMEMIRTPEAHAIQSGSPAGQVGIDFHTCSSAASLTSGDDRTTFRKSAFDDSTPRTPICLERSSVTFPPADTTRSSAA